MDTPNANNKFTLVSSGNLKSDDNLHTTQIKQIHVLNDFVHVTKALLAVRIILQHGVSCIRV